MPSWEEVLLFNEIFSYFLSREETDPRVIIFFEVRKASLIKCNNFPPWCKNRAACGLSDFAFFYLP